MSKKATFQANLLYYAWFEGLVFLVVLQLKLIRYSIDKN